MKIAILGCGPAGLLAATAVAQAGHEPVVLSKRTKSKIFGAQFLHRHIPGVTEDDPDFYIDIVKTGTEQGYAVNTYGDRTAPVSWGAFPGGEIAAWDLSAAYDNLWDVHRVDEVGFLDAADIAQLVESYPIIYSTLPLKQICCNHLHRFSSQKIKVMHGPTEEHETDVRNLIYYNGSTPESCFYQTELVGPDWYRFSQINGYLSWEYGTGRNPPEPDRFEVSDGIKPLWNSCDCWPTLRRIGRFGTWTKGQLTHHAYEQVEADLRAL